MNIQGIQCLKEIVSNTSDIDDKLWVPQPGNDNIDFYPLMFNISQGSFTNILRTRTKGILNKHRHHGSVQGYVIKGCWRYLEHDWIATKGTYVYEPPGEIHTLYSDSEEEMMTLFIISGGLTFLDEDNQATGYMDVWTKLEACKAHYKKNGLSLESLDQFVR